MSKKSKRSASDKRRKDKRARKDAAQKQFQSLSASGQNKKSKRNSKGGGTLKTKRHADVNCGNHGCLRCNSHLSNSSSPKSYGYHLKFRTSSLRPKPYKTSKEKLAFLNKKYAP